MNLSAIAEGARLLVEARRSRIPANRFPSESRPASADEADAVQQAVIAGLGERIAGWKVAFSEPYGLLRGAILSSRLFPDGARISAAEMPALGLEAEIAFRCDNDLPPRAKEYEQSEIVDNVTALVGVEIVDSRFRDAPTIPVIERAADCMSNGGFVVGGVRQDWRRFDLSALAASLLVNGHPAVVRRIGGHSTKDPIIPLIALANALRMSTGLFKGQVVTTGTYTGVVRCQAGDHVHAIFEDFGEVSLHIEA